MLATLSTPTFDPLGYLELDVLPASAFHDHRRRVNRTATLDGGAVFNDFGFADADRTVTLSWQVRDQDTEDAVDRLAQLYGQLQVSINGDVFLAAVEAFTPGATESRLSLLVAEKLTA